MKRFLSLLLALTMLFCLVGCGGNKTSSKDKDSKPNYSSSVKDKEEEKIVIRELDELPDNIKEFSDEEFLHYMGIIMPALIKLDIEALEPYLDEYNLDDLKGISEDENTKALWDKTIGNMIYIPSKGYLVAKDTRAMFSDYYTDAWKEGKEVPEEMDDLSLEEVNAIYDEYYHDAVYTSSKISIYDISLKEEDGEKRFDMDDVFQCVGFEYIGYMVPWMENYITYVFGDEADNTSLGYNYIDDKIEGYETFLDSDLSKVIEKIKNEGDLEEDILYRKAFELYYQDTKNRSKVEKWIDENVDIYRDISNIVFMIKATPEESFPYYTFTEEELEMIKDLPLYIKTYIFYWNDEEGRSISPYYDIVQEMIYAGDIEKLY